MLILKKSKKKPASTADITSEMFFHFCIFVAEAVGFFVGIFFWQKHSKRMFGTKLSSLVP